MKLLQLQKNGQTHLGLVTQSGIVDIAEQASLLGMDAPGTMIELIRQGEVGLKAVAMVGEKATALEEEIVYAPVVDSMEKIMCIGLNYAAHARESGMELPKFPVLFNKFSNALAANNEPVALPAYNREYDYEAELVIIIGKTMKNVDEPQALAGIFGYTAGNDLSIRDLQLTRGGQWLVGKTQDGFGPIGPVAVTADAIDPCNLHIESRVNGQVRQNSNTNDLIFKPATLVSYLSQHMTLKPGDIIFTGTPSGVILGYPKDKQVWLKPGDVVEIDLEGIGVLRTPLV